MADHLTGPVLEVDLDALIANWRLARAAFTGRSVTAVVKSDAYGLGLGPVVEALAEAGCGGFWVVSLDEALEVRRLAPQADVFALHGLGGISAAEYVAAGVQPVVACLDDLHALATLSGPPPRCAVQIDTGLTRLGLSEAELRTAREKGLFERVAVTLWVTHLARFDDLDRPLNALQRDRLVSSVAGLPTAPLCLAASSASFGPRQWHFDVARVGSALYGVPTAHGQHPPLDCVARLVGPVLRVAHVEAGCNIGYRELYATSRRSRIATVLLGYASGIPQAAGNRALVTIDGLSAPVVGGIAMNLLSVDVTDLPERHVGPSTPVEFFGPDRRIEQVAADLGLSPNVLLTQTGLRLRRRYLRRQPRAPETAARGVPVRMSLLNGHPGFKKTVDAGLNGAEGSDLLP